MKRKPTFTKHPSGNQKSRKKERRRHTRIHIDSLKPILATLQNDSCPKCQGYVRTEGGESLSQFVTRCLNCGWQPQLKAPIIQETEEARTSRSLSAQFMAEYDWHRIPITL